MPKSVRRTRPRTKSRLTYNKIGGNDGTGPTYTNTSYSKSYSEVEPIYNPLHYFWTPTNPIKPNPRFNIQTRSSRRTSNPAYSNQNKTQISNDQVEPVWVTRIFGGTSRSIKSYNKKLKGRITKTRSSTKPRKNKMNGGFSLYPFSGTDYNSDKERNNRKKRLEAIDNDYDDNNHMKTFTANIDKIIINTNNKLNTTTRTAMVGRIYSTFLRDLREINEKEEFYNNDAFNTEVKKLTENAEVAAVKMAKGQNPYPTDRRPGDDDPKNPAWLKLFNGQIEQENQRIEQENQRIELENNQKQQPLVDPQNLKNRESGLLPNMSSYIWGDNTPKNDKLNTPIPTPHDFEDRPRWAQIQWLDSQRQKQKPVNWFGFGGTTRSVKSYNKKSKKYCKKTKSKSR
jgi:hypothetical protein